MSGRPKILVVDDSPFIRKGLSDLLLTAGFDVVQAEDGAHALEVLERTDDIVLVTMDVNMPGFDGFETCRRIREKFSKPPPVVLATSKSNDENRRKGFEAGAKDFINKHQVREMLVGVVRDILEPSGNMADLHAVVAHPNAEIARQIAWMLEPTGLVAKTTTTAKQALAILEQRSCTMLIGSTALADMTGPKLCKEVRTRSANPDVPIIFTVAGTQRDLISDLFCAGAADYVIEPIVRDDFISRTRARLEQYLLVRAAVEAGKSADLSSAIAATHADAQAEDTRPPSLHVLVVDDSPFTAKMTRGIVHICGHSTGVAAHGMQAVELVEATFRQPDAPQYDLILMDLHMPVLDGVGATLAIRQMELDLGRAPTPIIAVSANSDEQTVKRCLEAGMTAIMPKPISVDGVRKLLGGWAEKIHSVSA